MKIELLVGSDEFWGRMQEDLAGARESAYVETFTFEGDRTGCALTDAIDASPAEDRRLLVDGYSRLVHSDRWIHGPEWRRSELRAEVRETWRCVRSLRKGGARVRFGNPLGPSPIRLARRNHKKLISIDGRISYLGGINFSDHNFAWHDMMLRIESRELGALLARDFDASWDGRPEVFDSTVGPIRLLSLNGRGNARGFAPVLSLIANAAGSVDVVSAYLSEPFTTALGEASRRGVHVRVLTPSENNKPNLSRHVIQAAHRYGFEVLRYHGGMSHMKAMVIDEEVLIAGSTNFDFMSYHILEEYVLISRDEALLTAFRDLIWAPDATRATALLPPRSAATRWGDLAVRTGARLAGWLALPPDQAEAERLPSRNLTPPILEGGEEAAV